MLLKISQYSQESTCVGVSFNKIKGLQACNFIKKRVQHSCLFFSKYCEIFKNSFFYRASRLLLLNIVKTENGNSTYRGQLIHEWACNSCVSRHNTDKKIYIITNMSALCFLAVSVDSALPYNYWKWWIIIWNLLFTKLYINTPTKAPVIVLYLRLTKNQFWRRVL